MGNKKTYILLALTVLVWGLIAYKILNAVNPDIPIPQKVTQTGDFKPYKLTQKEHFSIKADYRDPFLGTIKKRKKKSVVHKQKAPKKEMPKKIIFPSIVYQGIISPTNRNDKRFIIKIRGNTYLYKLAETHSNVQLISGDSKEVILQYKGEQKSIPLK